MKPTIISIPKPCHENWNEMAAADTGKFCNSCQHTVVDFTAMTDQEMLNIFTSGRLTCGRFLDTQLHRPLNAILAKRSFIRSGFIKKVAAALLIAQSIAHVSWAQSTGNIRGRILDKHKEPIINVIVQAKENGILRGTAVTDYDGYYEIKPLSAGRYWVSVIHRDYMDTVLKNILVSPQQPVTVDVSLELPLTHVKPEVIRMGLPITLIDKYNIPATPDKKKGNSSLDDEQIIHQGIITIDELVAPSPGVYKVSKRSFWQRINIFKRRRSE